MRVDARGGQRPSRCPAAGRRGVDRRRRRSRPSPPTLAGVAGRGAAGRLAAALRRRRRRPHLDRRRRSRAADHRPRRRARARDALAASHARGLQGPRRPPARRRPGPGPRAPPRGGAHLLPPTARGEVLLGQLKQHPETRHVPVFVVGPPAARIVGAARRRRRVPARALADAEAVSRRWPRRWSDFNARRGAPPRARSRTATGLDPATMTLLGAGEDVDVVKMPLDERARRAARRRRSTAWCCRSSDGGDARPSRCSSRSAATSALRELPIVVYTAEPLERGERARLDAADGGRSTPPPSPPRAAGRRDGAVPAPHRGAAAGRDPQAARRSCARPTRSFHGKRILIVDDDIRNVFALTSDAGAARHEGRLRRERPRGRSTGCASTADTDLVLLDVMMPEMDGYETARAIRGDAALRRACRSSRSRPRR